MTMVLVSGWKVSFTLAAKINASLISPPILLAKREGESQKPNHHNLPGPVPNPELAPWEGTDSTHGHTSSLFTMPQGDSLALPAASELTNGQTEERQIFRIMCHQYGLD